MDDPQTALPPGTGRDPKDVEDNKDLAAFSYLWIMSVVVYLTKRKSPFVRFHSRQGMVLFALSIACWFIPVIGRFLELALLGLMVLGFLNAAQGHWKDLPIIGPLSRREITIRDAWRQLVSFVAGLFKSAKSAVSEETNPAPSANSAATPERKEKQPISGSTAEANQPMNQSTN